MVQGIVGDHRIVGKRIVGQCRELWETELWGRMENSGIVHGIVGDTEAYGTVQGIVGEMEL